jgi:hypothetical protein
VELVAADWLDRDVIACLEEKCGTLVDAVLIAYASGGVGDELHSLGVREISTFGGADVYVPEGRERVVWARVVEYHDCVSPQPQAAKRPRHRPPDPIPLATVKDLKWELAQRKAKPRDPELTQEKIAGRLGLDRTRVQQAEALEKAGWDLLRSHPDFSANDDLVRWPSAEKAARILASERAEN